MRSNEFLSEAIEILCEKTTADELMSFLEPMGYDVKKKTNNIIKVIVPMSLRFASVRQIAELLPDSIISSDGKKIVYDGATVLVKPAEAQGAGLGKEEGQIIAIDSAIKEHLDAQPFINLMVGDRIVKAAGIIKVAGTVKADAQIIDSVGNPVAWISLKDGTSPLSFGQWGGLNHLGKNEELVAFVAALKETFGNEMPRRVTYGQLIKNPALKAASCFGKDFGKARGISNVDLILQGHPTIKKGPNGSYILNGIHTWGNGDIPSGEYEPVLTARFASDRSDFGIKGARITAYPSGGRPWKDIDGIKKDPSISNNPITTVAEPTIPTDIPASIQNQTRNLGSKIPMGSEPTPDNNI